MPDQGVDKLRAQSARTRKTAEQATTALTGDLGYFEETAEMALRAASQCQLEALARSLLLLGMHSFTIVGRSDRLIEDRTIREDFDRERFDLTELTGHLIAEALQENCNCRIGEGPLRLEELRRK